MNLFATKSVNKVFSFTSLFEHIMAYSRNTVVPETELLTSELGDRHEGSALREDGSVQPDAPRLPGKESVIV